MEDAPGTREKGRVSRKYAERQAKIIGIATRIINRRGVSGMTLAQVAAEMGMTPANVAYYFKTKEDLAVAAFLAELPRLIGIFKSNTEDAYPESVAGLIEAYFSFVARVADGTEDELISPNDIRALNSDEVSAIYANVFRTVRAQTFGRLPSAFDRKGVNALTHLLLAQFHWFHAWRFNIHPADYARSGRRVSDVLINGIANPRRRLDPEWFSRSLPPMEAGEVSGKDAFLQAATELINEQGYHGASVERISARLSVSKGSFYHHVEAKDDLITACFDRTISIIQSTIAEAEAQSSNALQALALLAATLVRRQLSGEDALLRLSAGTTLPEALQPNVYMAYNRIALRIASMFNDGIIDGSVRPIDSYAAAEVLLGMINTSDELKYFVRDMNFDVAAQFYIRPLFSGIRALR
ncbi:MAG: TetR/AcrR family transcriptional regulator [Alphaproteobacteria bacterium]|nr:TetR/AcrR family transcriptional regulator [Alphaproteobacteria bacterium]